MLKDTYESIKANNEPRPLSKKRDHWKCTKLCHFYKNKWPGTNKTMCQYVEGELKGTGMKDTINSCTKEGFSIGHYEAPG